MEEIPNFHNISEERKELRKAISDLGIKKEKGEYVVSESGTEAAIFNEHYKEESDRLDKEASGFKIANFKDSKKEARRKVLRDQKADYEKTDPSQIDKETVLHENPEIKNVLDVVENIQSLKDFRMKRMLEILNKKISLATRQRNESVINTVGSEIDAAEEKLEKVDLITLQKAKLIEYKQNLSQSGHICITPSVEKGLEAIGERILTGKSIFLHGPTGTGKTSLARFAASHFTGKDPEMVFCSPQTKESNIWGKTGIIPAKDGAIETVEIYGPLARAMVEGKVVIFDEFTALPKEQMVFIKGVFNAKVGDRINIVGNGVVEIKPGFQMIFTANLKSEKNPERQDLPPEIAREFEQNNLEVKYTPTDESYNIMLARLLNGDGSLDMSYYDLNTTLPNLCKVMSEIQESYTNETNKEVARKAGAVDASDKVYSLKKFVMTQGSVEAILSSWIVEKQIGKNDRTFAEFLDERFKTALTFKEYTKEDRILAAKILASHGFLTTLSAKDLDLPDDVFTFNPIMAMRGKGAVEELKDKSGDIKHLTLKDVAELDPFEKKAEILRRKAEAFLGTETGVEDSFTKDFDKRMKTLFGTEGQHSPEITTTYKYINPTTGKVERQENITLNIEKELQDFNNFYKKTNIILPNDFENTVIEIWERNSNEIQQAIEQNGFDGVLIIPPTVDIGVLSERMKMQNGYFDYIKSGSNTQTLDGIPFVSQNVDKPRIILVHKTQNLKDRPELASTLNIKGQDVKLDEALTLEDYLVFQRKYFEETSGKYLDEDGWTWLATKSGTRLVGSSWHPAGGRLAVGALGPGTQIGSLSVRPSRSFF